MLTDEQTSHLNQYISDLIEHLNKLNDTDDELSISLILCDILMDMQWYYTSNHYQEYINTNKSPVNEMYAERDYIKDRILAVSSAIRKTIAWDVDYAKASLTKALRAAISSKQ